MHEDSENAESETSSVEDAIDIFRGVIDKSLIKDIARRRRTIEQIHTMEPPESEDYHACIDLLKRGIVATKYNYSNKKHREVIL